MHVIGATIHIIGLTLRMICLIICLIIHIIGRTTRIICLLIHMIDLILLIVSFITRIIGLVILIVGPRAQGSKAQGICWRGPYPPQGYVSATHTDTHANRRWRRTRPLPVVFSHVVIRVLRSCFGHDLRRVQSADALT